MEVLDPAPIAVGLVITLRRPAQESASVLSILRQREDLTLGDVAGFWISVACCTTDPRQLHRDLEALPGVAQVDVIFVEMADGPSTEAI